RARRAHRDSSRRSACRARSPRDVWCLSRAGDRTRSDHEDAPRDQKGDQRRGLPERDERDDHLAPRQVGEGQPDRSDLRSEPTESTQAAAAANGARPAASSEASDAGTDRKGRPEDRVQVDRVQQPDDQVAGRRRDELRSEKRARGKERKEIALVHPRRHRENRKGADRESKENRDPAASHQKTPRHDEPHRGERRGANDERGGAADGERVRRPRAARAADDLREWRPADEGPDVEGVRGKDAVTVRVGLEQAQQTGHSADVERHERQHQRGGARERGRNKATARSAFDEMSADEHREHDDKADGLLRLDEDRENSESDCGLALSLDQQNERGNKQQGPDRVDLPPERGVVPSHRDEEVERRSDEPRALAEPAPRGPVEDGGDAEVGEDRWHLQQERERRGRGTAEEPQDVHVPGRVVGAGRRRVERARADPRERRRPAGEELHVAGKALLRVENEGEQNAKKQASRKDRDESRVPRERGHFAAARSYSVPKPPAILTAVPFAATQLAMLDDPPPPKPPPGPPPPPMRM